MTFSHIRAAQWKLTLGTEDRWAAFCRAAADWSKEKKGSSLEPLEDVVGQDADEDDDCQLEDDPAEVISMRDQLKKVRHTVTSALIQRFNDIAPASAVLQYEFFVTSQRFEDILLRECSAVGADRKAFDSMEACVGWLVELVDRKEADLQGMVADAHPPPGFLRGRGSAAGNNCLISSIAQALLGTGDQSQGHIDVCANIRRRGAGLFWDERSFIEASEAALAFICDCMMGGFPIIHMTLH